MKIHSYNEWDTLKACVVGTATYLNWPKNDPVYARESEYTTWSKTPVPSGPVPQQIIDEANEDLEGLCDILREFGTEVYRPTEINWQHADGFGTYCPRDRLLIAGDTIVDVNMLYPSRDQEAHAYEFLLTHENTIITMPREPGIVCDAANICRLNDKWLYLESRSGTPGAAEWLSQRFPNIDIYGCNFYSGLHIDSTITLLREGLAIVNGSRVTSENLPAPLHDWEIIYVDDVVEQDFYQYPKSSKWIAINMLSLDPNTVIIDAAQKDIITTLEARGLTVIPHALRHARTLGGGFHCVTLDIWRENAR